MRREPWAIGNTFAYAIRVLNSIFCRASEPEWTEEEKEMGDDNKWLVVEQINSMCSDMMVEDAVEILQMVSSIPTDRLCEKINCMAHHPENPRKHDYSTFGDRCGGCIHNSKSKAEDKIDYFEQK